MYCIQVINKINARPPQKPEDPYSRASSFLRSRGGIVLHSASMRSTAFIENKGEVRRFLAKARGLRQKGINQLVESYF